SLSFSANTTSPPAISTLSLHDALPIWAIILAAAKSCNRTDMKQPDAFLQTEIHQIGGSLYIDLKKSFSVFFLIGDQRSAMVYFGYTFQSIFQLKVIVDICIHPLDQGRR